MLRQIPGFRSGTRWKAAVAVIAYASMACFALIGFTARYPNPPIQALALSAFVFVLLWFNVAGVQRWVPGLQGTTGRRRATAWVAILLVLLIGSVATDAFVPESVRLERDAYFRASAATPTAASRTTSPTPPAAASTAAALAPTATPTPTQSAPPSPSVGAVSPTPTPSAGTPKPAAYQVVSRRDLSIGGRRRWEIRIVVPGELSRDQKISTLAAAARSELRPQVIVVNAYRTTAEERECGATVGQAELSTDGRGWNVNTGDTLRWGRDTGKIQGSVVIEVNERACIASREEQFSVDP